MVDLDHLRRTIADTSTGDLAAVVTHDWLQELERDLSELADRRAAEGDQKPCTS